MTLAEFVDGLKDFYVDDTIIRFYDENNGETVDGKIDKSASYVKDFHIFVKGYDYYAGDINITYVYAEDNILVIEIDGDQVVEQLEEWSESYDYD